MTNKTKSIIKRYAFSSLISFLTGFSLIFTSEIDSITLDTIKDGSYVGIVFLAFRGGTKAVVELFLLNFNNK